jgi:hypothetical protein
MFTVSQYDSYSYLFYQPTFISLDPTVKPTSIPVKGMRIGMNGTIPQVGQAYIPLNTTSRANYTAQGEILSNIGTVIGLQSGPLTDQFFLTFDQLGSQSHVVVEAAPQMPATCALGPIGRRLRCAHLCPGQLDVVGAHGRTHVESPGQYDLSGVQQQLPPIPRSRLLLGESSRRCAAGDSILQRHGEYAVVRGAGVRIGVTFSSSLFSRHPASIRSPARSQAGCSAPACNSSAGTRRRVTTELGNSDRQSLLAQRRAPRTARTQRGRPRPPAQPRSAAPTC